MFGIELRRQRLAAGLSLAALGKLVHYNKSYLSKIENGLKVAPTDLARRCDVALGANGELAALAPHVGTSACPVADGSDNADDVWMLSLAKNGMNRFMPASCPSP
ncbi:MAG TPA: helix-turn-helix transcriptional regulator [Pseudonocardiaceae bacterium]|jgi:transcriptional regulator with XRE-family HTH domain